MRQIREDSGAVAVLVAILLPTVLLTVGALAVDLGSVYVQKSAQDGLAELAALAGARKLPDIPEARKAALAVMCDPANAQPGWPADTCTYDRDDPATWRGARAQGTGQIVFYTDDDNHDGRFDDQDPKATGEGDTGVAIQITLPAVSVNFHFAQIFSMFPGGGGTFDSASVAQTATARIGTPLGTGAFPFYVTPNEVSAATNDNRFCVRDPQAAVDGGYPGAKGRVKGTTPYPNKTIMAQGETNRRITMSQLRFPFLSLGLPDNPKVVFVNQDSGQAYPGTNAAYTSAGAFLVTETVKVDVPQMPQGRYWMWVQNTAGTEVTLRSTFVVPTVGTPEPCFRPGADRGFLDVAREDTDDNNVADDLRTNVKRGVQPTMHTINTFPSLVDLTPILTAPALVTNLVCGSPLLTGLVTVVTALVNPFDINCVTVDPAPGFSDDVSDGLFDTGGEKGRMLRQCSPATSPTIPGRTGTIDGTDLFPADDRTPLVNNDAAGGPAVKNHVTLRNWIETHGAPVQGWLTDTIFSCPRFGLVPIVSAGPGADGDYAILGFTYVWLDDDLTAFPLTNGTGSATGVQGHIIDPQWFMNPATDGLVSGSTVVGDYMGPTLPKEAVLVRD